MAPAIVFRLQSLSVDAGIFARDCFRGHPWLPTEPEPGAVVPAPFRDRYSLTDRLVLTMTSSALLPDTLPLHKCTDCIVES